MPDASANYRGILAMIGASACFAANDACTKIAAQWLPSSEIVAIRGFFALWFAFAIIVVRRELVHIRRAADRTVMLRALAESLAGFLIIIALGLMPLANVIAILLVQPFLMTIAAVVMFKEAVGWRRWTAVSVGFLGMLLVVKPATNAFEVASLIAVTAAFMAMFRDLLTRRIGPEVPTMVITLASACVGVVIGALGAAAEPWKTPDFLALAVVALAAAFIMLAFIFIIIAFRGTEMSAVAPFRYTIVVFAVAFGIVLFAEIPDLISFAGIGLIVGAGLYLLHRETMQRRPKAAALP
jgi:drug/metabolite transporter (DMT)-like permease